MLKKTLLIMTMLVSLCARGQFNENFSDGDFTRNPVWSGDTSQFEVSVLQQMRLQTIGPDTSYLVTLSNRVNNTEWDFWLKMSFNTSANNFSRIYLASDQQDLLKPLHGYFLQVGGGNDSIVFMKQNGTVTEKLFTGGRSCTNQTTNIFRIRIIHDSVGIWHLFTDPTGGNNLAEEGSCFENSIPVTSWFGVFCRFTSSNATKFYFDDFYCGEIITDTLPPTIVSVRVRDSVSMELRFSEIPEKVSAENPGNYQTIFHGTPLSASLDSVLPDQVHLFFQVPFPDETIDTIIVSGVTDLNENVMAVVSLPFSYYCVKPFDVVINEIMADPEPLVGLPICEYAEIHNKTAFPVYLNGWAFISGSTSKPLPDSIIKPGGFLTLTKGNFLQTYGPSLDIFTSSTMLSNEGTTLILKNNTGKVIHTVTYIKEWYQNSIKEEGGWSIEMIDPGNPCGCMENWRASIDVSGGTPGRRNSVFAQNPDTTRPYIQRVRIMNDTNVVVVFSEPMDSLSLITGNGWIISEGIGSPNAIRLTPPSFLEEELILPVPLQKNVLYSVRSSGMKKDCAGNALLETDCDLAIPDSVCVSDIVINEILPNPTPGGERFVELYNRSGKVLDLKEILLSSYDTLGKALKDPEAVCGESFLFFPGEYLVLTKDPADIDNKYYCPDKDAFIKLSTMPSLTDDFGIVVIARKYDGLILDMARYSDEMQFPLLTTTDGISLERINPDVPSSDKSNWHSAATSSGYATPGYQNSQFMNHFSGPDLVNIQPLVFSPDNDGKDDVLSLTLSVAESGYYGNIRVYDQEGRLVKMIVSNHLFTPDEVLTWDGTDENRKRAGMGIYLVFSELILPSGKVMHFKTPVVLGGKL